MHVKIVECDISRTSIICNHNDLWNAIETIKFIIPQFATFILHIFFGDNSRFHILIRPFLITSVDIAAQRPLYYSLRFLFVKHCFVFAYNHASTSASVGGFQNKLTGQLVKIDIFESIPQSKGRDYVFFSNYRCHILFNLIFVDHLSVFRTTVVQFQPLQLFIVCLWIVKIQWIPHFLTELNLQKHSVGKHPTKHSQQSQPYP